MAKYPYKEEGQEGEGREGGGISNSNIFASREGERRGRRLRRR